MFDRKSIRLKHYDYSKQGVYFITICAYDRECLFGEIVGDSMILNEYGAIVQTEWLKTAEIRKEIVLDSFVIMPNHLHAVFSIINNDHCCDFVGANDMPVGANGRSPLQLQRSSQPCMRSKSVSSLVAGFKSTVTKQINEIRKTPRKTVWQRNYYEQVVRNDKSLARIRKYIIENPLNWRNDSNNPGTCFDRGG